MKARILHLSDLHFSAGYAEGDKHRHHLGLLRSLSDNVSAESWDKVIVSGDLSDDGSMQSLLNCRNFLTSSLLVSPELSIGLNLKGLGAGKMLSVIPGNHDAHNGRQGSGKCTVIWQSATDNFYTQFPEASGQRHGCDYEWIERGDWGIFIVYVDSCYLGDPADSKDGTGVVITDRIAVGKIAKEATERILDIYGKGISGRLSDPVSGRYIDASKFATGFKIMVMHHYLFEHEGAAVDFFHRMKDRDRVFQNLALADFDVLLCGHKHSAFSKSIKYAEYFDPRARTRYGFNYLRRILGLNLLPVQERVNGRIAGKIQTLLAQLGIVSAADSAGRADPETVIEEIASKVQQWIDRPDNLRKFVDAALKDGPLPADYSIDEVRVETKHILQHVHDMSRDHKTKIAKKLREIRSLFKQFEERVFLQIMCGSSSKCTGRKGTSRHYHVYCVERTDREYVFECHRYSAAAVCGDFEAYPKLPSVVEIFKFPHDRVQPHRDSIFAPITEIKHVAPIDAAGDSDQEVPLPGR
ncbi:MAG: metallophosphoesterase [Phycisphaeraceae bacterium]|nr:metallophosphoesterase [Phycisphaeraceae bacterium]